MWPCDGQVTCPGYAVPPAQRLLEFWHQQSAILKRKSCKENGWKEHSCVCIRSHSKCIISLIIFNGVSVGRNSGRCRVEWFWTPPATIFKNGVLKFCNKSMLRSNLLGSLTKFYCFRLSLLKPINLSFKSVFVLFLVLRPSGHCYCRLI